MSNTKRTKKGIQRKIGGPKNCFLSQFVIGHLIIFFCTFHFYLLCLNSFFYYKFELYLINLMQLKKKFVDKNETKIWAL